MSEKPEWAKVIVNDIILIGELRSKITDLRVQRDNYKAIAEEAMRELELARKAIATKDVALRLAMNAFENNWAIDWDEIESAITPTKSEGDK